MSNLLSGAFGAIAGSLLISIVTFLIFRRQARIESNRVFLKDLVRILQRTHGFVLYGKTIPQEEIDYLASFRIVAYSDFDILSNELDAINIAIAQYNEGVKRTLQETSTSHLELSAKEEMTKHIRNLILKVRRLT